MSRNLISLGDALRAAADLNPRDDETREAILKLLGLESAPSTPAQRSIGAWKPSSATNVVTAQHLRRAERPRFAPPERAAPRRPGSAERTVRSSSLSKTSSGSGVFRPPSWLTAPGDSLAIEIPAPPPEMQPLFGRVTERGILSAALATAVPEGELDLERIIEIVGCAKPLDRLPRLPAPTLRRGVQLLLDCSEAMDPFARDQIALERALDDVLADDRLEVLRFDRCPGRGVGDGERSGWGPWRPPPPGTPVLAVTDLGIGGRLLDDDRPTATEWVRFADRVRAEGHHLIALVPYEAGRWPPAVARALTALHWSERTSVGEVRRAMRDAFRSSL